MRRLMWSLAALVLGAAGAGCATQQMRSSTTDGHSTTSVAAVASTASTTPTVPQAHPQAVEPVAGAGSPSAATTTTQNPDAAAVNVGSSGAQLARPVSDAQVRQELAASGLAAGPNQATLTRDGLAVAPIAAPPAVQEVIAAGNQIAHLPYVWGGGHGTYVDTGYDCSGSISFVFQAAHLLSGSVVSGDLAHWGAPGPGKWITIFANGGHTFMYIAGLRFDTVALAETGTRWSARSADESNLASFSVRHPPGL